jgi:hypothetical protein
MLFSFLFSHLLKTDTFSGHSHTSPWKRVAEKKGFQTIALFIPFMQKWKKSPAEKYEIADLIHTIKFEMHGKISWKIYRAFELRTWKFCRAIHFQIKLIIFHGFSEKPWKLK